MDDEILKKKARAWDLMAMREQINSEINKLNQEIFELVQKTQQPKEIVVEKTNG